MTALPTALQGLTHLNHDERYNHLYNQVRRMPLGERLTNNFLPGEAKMYDGFGREVKILDAIMAKNKEREEKIHRYQFTPTSEVWVFTVGISPYIYEDEGKIYWVYKRANWDHPCIPNRDFNQFCHNLAKELGIDRAFIDSLLNDNVVVPATHPAVVVLPPEPLPPGV
jgi:hypothetical protein